jgi:hypothetical protein
MPYPNEFASSTRQINNSKRINPAHRESILNGQLARNRVLRLASAVILRPSSIKRMAAAASCKTPIVDGVVFAQPGTRASARTYLRGDYILDERQSRQVENIFRDSASSAGYELPDNFLLQEGEIFYKDGKIDEIRLAGTLSQLKGKRKKSQESWCFAGKEPGFELTSDFGLVQSPQDQHRTHVAVLRLGDFFILSWDVAANAVRHVSDSPEVSNVDKRFIRIAASAWKSEEDDDDVQSKELYDTAIRSATSIVEAASDMKMLFVQLRDGRALNTSGYDRSFRHAFTPLLKQLPDVEVSKRQGQGRLLLNPMSQHDLNKALLKAVLESAKEHLSFGPGRPPKSKTKNRTLNLKKIEIERKKKERLKKKILVAITAEYKKFCRKWSPTEAEFQVKAIVVIKRLGASRSTFYNWLKLLGCNFSDLKTEALECAEN